MDKFNPSSVLSTQDIDQVIIRVKNTELVENTQLHQDILKSHHAECKKNPKLANIRYYKRLKDSTLYTLYDANNDLNLGVILTSKLNEEVHYIEYMDSFLKGNQVCERMINKYMSKFDKLLIPYEIINDSSIYWLRFFYDYGFTSYEMLVLGFSKTYNISTKDVKWDLLEYQFENFAKFLEIFKKSNALDKDQMSETFRKFRQLMTHTTSFMNMLIKK